jgi:hypothetical protein
MPPETITSNVGAALFAEFASLPAADQHAILNRLDKDTRRAAQQVLSAPVAGILTLRAHIGTYSTWLAAHLATQLDWQGQIRGETMTPAGHALLQTTLEARRQAAAAQKNSTGQSERG